MEFSSSIIVMILGLLIVFTGLVILILAIKLMSALVGRVGNKRDAPASAPVMAAPAPVVQEASEEAEDLELIAVISAAIAAFEGNGKKLVVRSVRRLGGNGWAATGRGEQMGL